MKLFLIGNLLKRFGQRKGIKYFEKNWENEILFNQILYFKPEVIFFQNNVSLSDEYMNRLKNDFKFLKKSLYIMVFQLIQYH